MYTILFTLLPVATNCQKQTSELASNLYFPVEQADYVRCSWSHVCAPPSNQWPSSPENAAPQAEYFQQPNIPGLYGWSISEEGIMKRNQDARHQEWNTTFRNHVDVYVDVDNMRVEMHNHEYIYIKTHKDFGQQVGKLFASPK